MIQLYVAFRWILEFVPYSTISSTEHPEENWEFSTGFLQPSSEIQNDIVKSSTGSENVRFSASWGAPKEYLRVFPTKMLGRSQEIT